MPAPPLPPLPPEDLAHARAVVGDRWTALKGQHLLLTGGTGFVGKWLLATLLDADRHFDLGCRVTVLTRHPQAFAEQAPDLANAAAVELVQGDVRQPGLQGRAFDRIVHAATDVAASASEIETFDTCLQGTREMLSLAQRCSASLLLVSSGAVYGRQPPDIACLREDHPAIASIEGASAYEAGKRAAEWVAHAHARAHGLDVRTARCFAFVGPYLPLDAHFAIGNFLRDALAGQPIVIQGDGTPLRSYLHAADMAAWLWAIVLDARARGGVYNVGGHEALSIRQLAGRVVQAAGSSSEIHVMQPARSGTPPARYVPDVAKVRTALELPAPIGLGDAIHRTARWVAMR